VNLHTQRLVDCGKYLYPQKNIAIVERIRIFIHRDINRYINFLLKKKYVFVYMKIIANDGRILEKEICVHILKKGYYDNLLHA